MSRPVLATIDLSALANNFALAQELAPNSNTLAVVKANAYGHGALAIAKALQPLAPAFGVASIEEALELRKGGITKPILLMEGPFHAEEIEVAAEQRLWLMLHNLQQLQWLEAASLSHPISTWIKVDTGMHRLGIAPQQAASTVQRIRASTNVTGDPVLATHFAEADSPSSDITKAQITRFQRICAPLNCPTSLANSAGILAWPSAQGTFNRPGIMLYGSSPFEHPHVNASRLQPVMTFSSRVIALREVHRGEQVGYGGTWTAQRPSKIATVATGYGDGYPRHAGNGTPVVVAGKLAPLAGRVSMDMITVDITDLPHVNIGDEVELWGKQLSVDQVARHSSTLSYELFTRMPQRVKRIYLAP